VGALDQLRSASGDDGLVGRARSNPWLLVAIVGGAIVILAWIGWAIHVSNDAGARAALGVLIAWPAMLAALALISLPFIVGGYLLIRRVSASGGETMATAAEVSDEGEEEDEGEDTEEAGDGSAEEEDPEEGAAPEAAAS
jgi:hypothetical protein